MYLWEWFCKVKVISQISKDHRGEEAQSGLQGGKESGVKKDVGGERGHDLLNLAIVSYKWCFLSVCIWSWNT